MMIRFDSGMIIDYADVGDNVRMLVTSIIYNHKSVCNKPEDILNYLRTSHDPQMKHDAKIFLDVD